MLKTSYAEDDILEAFERFEALEKEGLLFNRGENLTETLVLESERRKLLVAIPYISKEKNQMKTNLRGKIREFMQSEEGKTGLKAPLTLGIATGSVLLAQAIMAPTPALACGGDADCAPHRCDFIKCSEPYGAGQVTCWGVCGDD